MDANPLPASEKSTNRGDAGFGSMRATQPGGVPPLPGKSPTHFQAFTGLFALCLLLNSAHGCQITPAQKRWEMARV